MNEIQIYVGYTAGVLGLIPFVIFIRAMLRGTSRPNLAGWILYDIAMLMIVTSSIALGAWQAVWLAVAYLIGQSVMIGLSFKTGYFTFSKFDYAVFSLSILGLLLWIYTSNPLYALILNVGVDALGSLSIARKLYVHPGTEDRGAWTLCLIISILNIFAVASFDISNALYPVVIVIMNILITALSFRRAKDTDVLANEAMDRGA